MKFKECAIRRLERADCVAYLRAMAESMSRLHTANATTWRVILDEAAYHLEYEGRILYGEPSDSPPAGLITGASCLKPPPA